MARPENPSRMRLAIRFGLLVLVMVAVLLSTSLLLAALFGALGVCDDVLANAMMGLACSLIAWLFIAVFHLSRVKIAVPVPSQDLFLGQVRLLLDEMGYEVTWQTTNSLMARPRFNAFLFGDAVRVSLEGAQATVQGPKILAEILRSRLRLMFHLFHVQSLLQEERKTSDAALRRVEIALRCKPEQLAAVHEQVLAPLARSGEVLLDLHVLVQSADGVPASTLDQLQPWARCNDIACEFPRRLFKQAAQDVADAQAEAIAV